MHKKSLVVLLIGIIFFLSAPVLASTPGNVSSCQALDTSGVYTLNRSLVNENVTSACFNVTAAHVELDCQGFLIRNTTLQGIGVYSARINTTVRNCNITMSSSGTIIYGIQFFSANNSLITNVTLTSNGGIGAYILSTFSTTINSLKVISNTEGLRLESSNNNTLINITSTSNLNGLTLSASSGNTVTNVTTSLSNSGVNQAGLSLTAGSSNNTLSFINASSNNVGLSVSSSTSINNTVLSSIFFSNDNMGLSVGSSSNTFSNLTFVSNSRGILVGSIGSPTSYNILSNLSLYSSSEGIVFQDGSYNNLSNVYINNTGRKALTFTRAISFPSNTLLNNVTISNTNATYPDVSFDTGSINGTEFVDSSFTFLNFSGAGGTIILRNSFGQVSFLEPVNGSVSNISTTVTINQNLTFINSSLVGFNKSANITLYNLSTSFANPAIYRDGSTCASSICTAITSLNNGNVTFNVTSGGTYYIAEDSSSSSSSSSGSNSSLGGGGGSGLPSQYFLTEHQLTAGYSALLGKEGKYRFSIGQTQHTITLKNFNSTSATVLLQSTPQTISLLLEIPYQVDLDASSPYVLSLTLKRATTTGATVYVRLISREITKPRSAEPFQESPQISDSRTDKKTLISLMSIIAILFMAILFLHYTRSSR